MKYLIRYRPMLLALLVCLALLQAGRAYAQKEGIASITEPELKSFPAIAAYLDVHDAGGNFISGLLPGDVTILENEHPLPAQELVEQQPGVRILLAVNAGPNLGIRDLQGVSRYDLVAQSLQAWLGKLQSRSQDEYGLLANRGVLAALSADPQAVSQALKAYQPDMRLAKPDTQGLSQAIDQASDPVPRVGMGRAILYITPVPEKDVLAALTDLSARAQQMGVHIFVWVVAGQDSNGSDGMKALEQLSMVTGGAFFAFTGSETLPDPGVYLEPLGRIYALKYTSTINQTGRHSLAVKVAYGGAQINSTARFFSVTVKPPNPILVSPPAQVERANHPSTSSAAAGLWPAEQALEIMVEFPDGHPRPLKAARLYVDGIPVAENTHEPFNNFKLALDAYTASKTIKLKVEVEDSLGLVGASIESPLQIVIVKLPAASAIQTILRNTPWLAVGAALLAGGVLAGVLVVAWRRRKSGPAVQVRRGRKDPLAQTVRPRREPIRLPHLAWSARFPWPRSSSPAPLPALAHLIRLSEQGQPLEGSPIAITSREITFGRDPTLATVVIDLPSVDGLHARLRQNEDGSFTLSDQGSVAGTWVNYAPISTEGLHLEQGDLVHIGKTGFRFQYGASVPTRKVVVSPFNEEA